MLNNHSWLNGSKTFLLLFPYGEECVSSWPDGLQHENYFNRWRRHWREKDVDCCLRLCRKTQRELNPNIICKLLICKTGFRLKIIPSSTCPVRLSGRYCFPQTTWDPKIRRENQLALEKWFMTLRMWYTITKVHSLISVTWWKRIFWPLVRQKRFTKT